MKTIAIIGGGWSGILTAIQLLEKSKDISIKIINSEQLLGLGIAYSTSDESHLLNVPAGKMSAFPDNPKHFTDWLIKKGYPEKEIEKQFLPRLVYGKYIQEFIDSIKQNAQVEIINARAIDIHKESINYSIQLNNENSVSTDKIVLALGNFLPATPKSASLDFFESPNYFKNPWNTDYLKNIQINQNILIMGTGLTMVDCVISLKKAGITGKLFVVSPRGYTPAPHGIKQTYPDFYAEIKGKTLLEIFKIVRKHLKLAESKNIPWIGVVDSLRPNLQKLWISLSLKGKQQFISHIRHIWGLARHRLPLSVHTQLMDLKTKGQLEIIGGRILDMQEKNNTVSVTLRLRKSTTICELNVSRVINCTGPQTNYKELQNELVKNLLSKRMILADDLKMGIKTTLNGQVLEKDNTASTDMYAIGSLLRGVLWETTAVPEIRMQAESIAKQIIDSIK